MREYSKKPESQSRTLDSNSKAFRQAPIDVILQRHKELNIQREERPNNTGLPDNLKAGIENLSDYSMDDVKVHYNSGKPIQLQALAYAHGTDIHIAPGQEKHLPHEAWHIVQQKQGRVQPTMQLQGINVNDNEDLEKEADEFGKEVNFSIIQKKIKSLNKMNSTAQCITDEYARGLVQGMNLDYDEIVLPALNTYLSKRHLVNKDPIRTIGDMDKEKYLFFASSLAHEGDYTGKKFIKTGTWYRGIGFAHFSYRVFKETGGILCGEGPEDTLVWSMGDSSTRWLPGATEPNICSCGPVSQAKYLTNYPTVERHTDIIGIIVRKDLSNANPAYFETSPESEAAIRGPQRVELAFLVNLTGDLIPYNNITNLPDPQ